MTESTTNETSQQPENEKMMSLFEHLDELRRRLFKGAMAITAVFCVAMFFSNDLIKFLQQPLLSALPQGSSGLHFTGPMDVFVAQIQIGVMVAILFSCPYWLYQLWGFIEPALYSKEKKYARPFLFAAVVLFFSGVSFCYFLVIPKGMEILIGIGTESGATAIITINDYFSLLTILVLGFGVVFELPVVLILLALLDVISADILKQYRKAAIILILIVAAILTPPDPFSQLMMATPMWIMFEVSIIIIDMIKSKDGKRE